MDPYVNGGKDGASWKEGLADSATLENVTARAKETLDKLDGKEMLQLWKTLHSATTSLKNHQKQIGNVNVQVNEVVTECWTAVQKGRVMMSEGLLLEAFSSDSDADDLKSKVSKQIRELAKVSVQSVELHPAIFNAAQLALRGKGK